ncbi:MAG TPA: alpha-amylase family glycosyl hydrolase [Chthoniobacteraceae bacterium]|jgi:alpha-amylase|nr:alpha-amylase family glycosyl hydrolase [Chthoniobacteraceae bacterium]
MKLPLFSRCTVVVCAILAGFSLRVAADDGVAAGIPEPAKRNVIVQLFNWSFKDIEAELPRLKKLGYSHIHVSPPQKSNEKVWQWWGRYQPIDFSVIGGPLGSEAEFRSMNTKADAVGIAIIVDVVFNHTVDVDEAPEFVKIENNRIVSDKFPQFGPDDFHPRCDIHDNDINSVHRCWLSNALADLNTESPHVRQVAKDYLSMLVKMGVDGFRFDAAKHIEPEFFAEVLKDFGGSYSFGEVIAGDEQQFPHIDTLDFYDFPLVAEMRRDFGLGGDLRNLRHAAENHHALPGPKAVTFVRNHDIDRGGANDRGLDFGSLNFFGVGWDGGSHKINRDDVALAYAFIMGREDGLPYVFADMKSLPADQQDDKYDDARLAAFVRFHNLCLGGQDGVDRREDIYRIETPNTIGWQRGTDRFVVINKAAEPFQVSDLGTSLKPGKYQEVHEGWELVVQADGKIKDWKVPGRTAVMFVPKP